MKLRAKCKRLKMERDFYREELYISIRSSRPCAWYLLEHPDLFRDFNNYLQSEKVQKDLKNSLRSEGLIK